MKIHFSAGPRGHRAARLWRTALPQAAVAFLLAITIAGTAWAGPSGSHSYSGDFTAVRPDTCPSPVGICTHGTLTGSVLSTYDFVADTLVFTSPNTADYTGHDVIETAQGAEILGSDTGTLTIRPDGVTADFVTTVNVIGGTRQYEDATGQIVAPGVLDLVTGSTSGTYSGTIYLG
jgi:hypothetical protein